LANLPENCPICGRKMEKGYVTAFSSPIFWGKEKTRWSTWSAEVIAGSRVQMVNPNAEGYMCRSCKIVLFYGEKIQPAEVKLSKDT